MMLLTLRRIRDDSNREFCLLRVNSNGPLVAISWCGVAAIGTALRESRPPGFSYHSSNWHGVPDLLCQNARDDNLVLTEIVNGKLCNRGSGTKRAY